MAALQPIAIEQRAIAAIAFGRRQRRPDAGARRLTKQHEPRIATAGRAAGQRQRDTDGIGGLRRGRAPRAAPRSPPRRPAPRRRSARCRDRGWSRLKSRGPAAPSPRNPRQWPARNVPRRVCRAPAPPSPPPARPPSRWWRSFAYGCRRSRYCARWRRVARYGRERCRRPRRSPAVPPSVCAASSESSVCVPAYQAPSVSRRCSASFVPAPCGGVRMASAKRSIFVMRRRVPIISADRLRYRISSRSGG